MPAQRPVSSSQFPVVDPNPPTVRVSWLGHRHRVRRFRRSPSHGSAPARRRPATGPRPLLRCGNPFLATRTAGPDGTERFEPYAAQGGAGGSGTFYSANP
ncbi:hypothetical protein GCM10010326_62490 [Streptomyces xanthochromogenes]|uniref:Uncharacterized protein n=1 Tax=Streptomyces xanthochromogenes TaxID=67384 RepID=A0ABQ3AKX4_9ACTN|nr:hypothetical protein GCM10010326_62490 [Streptomyces xanthochromogenes]